MNPLRALSESAPVLGLAALLVLPQLGRHESAAGVEVQARNAEVLTAIDAAPYRIGQWIGEDVAVPPAALEILQTNAILSRRFRHLTSGINANLLVVHCSDARDMQGHYPPVCYPANGWILPEGGGRRSIACEGGGGPQDLTV